MATLTTTDIEALFEALVEGWNRGDADAVAATYAPDGRIITPFGDEHDGQLALRDSYASYFATLLAGTQTSVRDLQVRPLDGDLVVVDATQSISGLPDMHVTAVVRRTGERAEIVEARPFVFLPKA